jgi:hypothetical protein
MPATPDDGTNDVGANHLDADGPAPMPAAMTVACAAAGRKDRQQRDV